MDKPTANLARDLLRLNDLDGASQIANAEIERVTDQGADAYVWQLRFVRAEIMRLRGKPEEALRYLESKGSLSPPEAGDFNSRAGLSMHCGYHLGLMARYGPGHRLLAEAEDMSREAGLPELQGEVQLRKAMILFIEKDNSTSERAFRAVLRLSEELGGWYFRGSALWGIGKNLMIQGHYREATPWLEESLKIFENAGAQLSVAIVGSDLGCCHLGWGDDAKALELFQKSAKAHYESGVIHNYQVALANIGNVYMHRREHFTAISYYRRALELARETVDPVSVKKWTFNIRLAYARIRLAVDEQHPKPA